MSRFDTSSAVEYIVKNEKIFYDSEKDPNMQLPLENIKCFFEIEFGEKIYYKEKEHFSIIEFSRKNVENLEEKSNKRIFLDILPFPKYRQNAYLETIMIYALCKFSLVISEGKLLLEKSLLGEPLTEIFLGQVKSYIDTEKENKLHEKIYFFFMTPFSLEKYFLSSTTSQ